VLISHSDRFTAPTEVGTPNTGVEPSWISNSTLDLSEFNGTQWYYTLGMPEAAQWFEGTSIGFPEIRTLADAVVAPCGDRLAVVWGDNQEKLVMIKVNGPPPAQPSEPRECFVGPKGKFVDPTWSSNGSQLYWQEDDGVWLAQIKSPTDCSGEPALLIPGGSEPDASPAADSPGPRPGCGNPGNPTACPPSPSPPAAPGPCTSCAAVTAVHAALTALLKAASTGLMRLKLHGLRAKRKLVLSFSAPAAGTLFVRLTMRSGKRTVLLASGRRSFAATGKATLTLVLSNGAAKTLKHLHALHGVLTASFQLTGGGGPLSATGAFALR
jgi:hypothetical protein